MTDISIIKSVYPADTSDRPIPAPVVMSLYHRFGDNRDDFIAAINAIQWDSMNGCWCFNHGGMYIGVEEDSGYMHT